MKKTLLLALFGLPFLAAQARAEEIQVPSNGRKALAVTIYNESLALVKDSREADLRRGINDVAFAEVSEQMNPSTALLKGSGFTVLEQNFNFDVLSPHSLLKKSEGQKIQVIETAQSGARTVEEATVLAVDQGVVLKIGNRIETGYPGRMVFDRIPETLRAKPTLVLTLQSEKDAKTPLELSYLTGGLSWQADYVAELSPDDATLDLNGLVTLTNRSEVAFENADLQLVAGSVNIVRPMMMKASRTMDDFAVAEMAAPAPSFRQEAFGDYHLYSLGRKTTLLSKQTKQVGLLSSSGVKTNKEYEFVNMFGVYPRENAESPRRNADVFQLFENRENNRLGMPLPAGTIRVYKADSRGRLLFVGEDRIPHTAKNEKVRIRLGSAFDITAEGKRTDLTVISNSSFEAGYEITLKNAKNVPAQVNLYQDFPANWRMLSESSKHVKENSSRALWKLSVPPESELKLSFKVIITGG